MHYFWKAYIGRMSFGLAEGSTDLDPWWQPYFIVNKTLLVSYSVYRRKSLDRFRICFNCLPFFRIRCVKLCCVFM